MNERKSLREGFTTGTCAAGAALASVMWQRDNECPLFVNVELPKGTQKQLKIIPHDNYVCGVIKDAGDDIDVTDGCEVMAKVTVKNEKGGITFVNGGGVGTVTLDGLKLPVGEIAINPVPREMIMYSIRKIIGDRAAEVQITIPNGEELAKKTFNERVGVVGGLSILGTTGIVRPMSEDAVKESLALELNVVRKRGHKTVTLVTGFTGEKMFRKYNTDLPCVHASNYIGFMLDTAHKLGFERVIIFGGTGKLVKLAAGIMNTHSHEADGRNEVICTHAALHGAPTDVIKRLYECATTKASQAVIDEYNLHSIWTSIAKKGAEYCRARVYNEMLVDVVLIDDEGKIIASTDTKCMNIRG